MFYIKALIEKSTLSLHLNMYITESHYGTGEQDVTNLETNPSVKWSTRFHSVKDNHRVLSHPFESLIFCVFKQNKTK